MSQNQNTNMHFYEKKLTSVYRFKGLGTWKPIQARCLRSQEGDEMIISARIALENSFQI